MKYNFINSIMVRRARDDFEAFEMANAMQSLPDVEVVSIVYQERIAPNAFIDCPERPECWHVFCKYNSHAVTIAAIDKAINKAIDGEE
jgi:hypothetical protein